MSRYDGDVFVWVDPNIRNMEKKGFLNEYDEDDQEKISLDATTVEMSNMKRMGLSKQLEKDARMFKLESRINSKKWTHIEQAIDGLDTSKKTIIKYLKELGLQLIDGDQLVGSLSQNASGRNRQNRLNNVQSKSGPKVIFCSGDPALGGKVITREEHYENVRKYKNKEI